MKKYITTPIYYVNDIPHIGHAYTTVAADVLSRFYRLKEEDVFFLTGTDEHGTKVAGAAESLGKSAKDFCDEISFEFVKEWKNLDIKYDRFIRTTDAGHIKCVKTVLKELYDRKQIYKGIYEGLYCTGCEKFLAESDLVEGVCPHHKKKPEKYSEENYFFKLSLYKDKLIKILSDKNDPDYMEVKPDERKNEIIGKLKLGLDDISISRSKVEWGVPLIFDESQTTYVWIDALINYISAIGCKSSSGFNKWWPADCHLMAKDILWFHAVIWPAVLMAIGISPPKKLFAHGFFTLNGQKMSKSLKNMIRPSELTGKFGVDATRYLLLSLFPFGIDGDISWDALTKKYNADLANNIGNLLARTIAMVEKYFDGKTPSPGGENKFSILDKIMEFDTYMKNLEFHLAINVVQSAADASNKYIEETAPWVLFKKNDPKLANVLYGLLESIGIITIHFQVFMPNASEKMWASLGAKKSLMTASEEFFDGKIDFLLPGSKISKSPPLFPRI